MCPPDIAIKSEEAEYTLPGPSQSDDQGAKAEHDVPELQLRPKSVDSKLVTLNDEDNDDPLASLCALFDGLWPDSDSESQEASVKLEDAKHTLLTPSRCDNQGAKAEHDISELQLQPNAVDPKLATLKAEDDDDPPTSPCAQSDGTWPDDDSDSDSNDSESRPGSPLCKGNSEILLETFTNNTGAATRSKLRTGTMT
ncbi:hypothetical protein FRC12_013863 [Ceratobasidium sp. 428]|nr:hypothetical protein FRC12_013863 [Ceratobasidium sp. 428]